MEFKWKLRPITEKTIACLILTSSSAPNIAAEWRSIEFRFRPSVENLWYSTELDILSFEAKSIICDELILATDFRLLALSVFQKFFASLNLVYDC